MPTLKWNKYDDISQTVTGIVVTKNIVWQTTDIKDQELRCESIHPNKNDTTYVIAHVLCEYTITFVRVTIRSIYMQFIVIKLWTRFVD